MLEAEKIMHARRSFMRNAALLAAVGVALCGCDSAFVSDNDLVPGYAGRAILPPTLPTDDVADASDDTPAASTGPHHVIVAVPLSSDSTALAMLSAGVRHEAAPAGTHFVLLVLSPPANDAAALDRTNTAARQAAIAAVKILGDTGVPADHVEVSMATSPNAGNGEMRLYSR